MFEDDFQGWSLSIFFYHFFHVSCSQETSLQRFCQFYRIYNLFCLLCMINQSNKPSYSASKIVQEYLRESKQLFDCCFYLSSAHNCKYRLTHQLYWCTLMSSMYWCQIGRLLAPSFPWYRQYGLKYNQKYRLLKLFWETVMHLLKVRDSSFLFICLK